MKKNDRDSFYDSLFECVTFAIQDEIRSDSKSKLRNSYNLD